MSLCPYANLEISLSSSLTASDQGTLLILGELFNVSTLNSLLPTYPVLYSSPIPLLPLSESCLQAPPALLTKPLAAGFVH